MYKDSDEQSIWNREVIVQILRFYLVHKIK